MSDRAPAKTPLPQEGPIFGTVRELLDHWAETRPQETFLLCPDSGSAVTFEGLRDAAAETARCFAGLGIAPGEGVAYALGNGYGATLGLLACLYGGYRATAINLAAGPEVLAYVLEHSEARLVLCGPEQRAPIESACAGLAGPPRLLGCDSDAGARWPEDAPLGDLPPAPGPEAEGLLIYTSGTTGRPKGVLLTQRSLLAGGRNTAAAHRLTPADRALCVLPLYHINGLCVTVMAPLVSGGSVAMPPRFSASRFWHQAAEGACSWFSVVPTQIAYLLHRSDKALPDLSRLRFGRSASAPLAPKVLRAFEARFGVPIVETMGLTESAAQILSNPLPPGRRVIGSPGFAWGNEVVIADDRQREQPRGQSGEILVRGPNVMKDYFKDPAATAAALTPEGWLRTGDLGRMDGDGYVFVTGRLKEVIIKGGENIAPREIDEALCGHPAVLEAAAFARPCTDYGQRIEACVVLGAAAEEAELIRHCAARVGGFKAPERIHFMEDLPKGPSGKIQRLKLLPLVEGH